MKLQATTIATICLSIIGCGGGSSDPDTSVLTGVFIDSAVEGASYSTATQSGTTNAQGQFNYIAGEQVTFSVGDTQLPVVNAAPQVSPVEMAANSTSPSATTTNIARLLQSLDTDGNPDNGITISPTAAANAASIDFNVSEEQFSNDTNVINLVANSGSVTTTLISAADANAHLNDTLGATDQESAQPTITSHFLASDNSQLTVMFSVDMIPNHSTEGEYVSSNRYWLDPRTFVREFSSVQEGGSIRLIAEGFMAVSGETLAEGLEVFFPVISSEGDVTLSTLAGFYDSTVDGISQYYLLINADGTATEYEESQDGGNCFDVESWRFSSLGGDLFSLERPDRGTEDLRIARQNGDLVLNSDSDSERVVMPQVTSISPSDIAICS